MVGITFSSACSSTPSGFCLVLASIMPSAPYTMFSATDFFPAYITEFMNFVITMFPNFGSGSTSRFSAEWRRDILSFLRHGRACPGHPRLNSLIEIPGSHFVRPGMTYAMLRSFRTLGAILRTALLAVLDALGIQHAAENVVAHAGQVLDAAAADHDHRVLLQVMALTRDVTDHLEAIGQAHLGDLAKRRVRLLRGRGVDARANAALLRRLLQCGHLLARLLYDARTCDQLVDRRHLGLHPLVRAEPASAPQSLISRGLTAPPAPLCANDCAKRNRASHPSLSGKRFDATEDHEYDRSAFAVQPAIGVMHPSLISRGRAQEN